jgi:hypothetical protein
MSDIQRSDMAILKAEGIAVSFNINIQKEKNKDESQIEYQSGNSCVATQPDNGSRPQDQERRQSRYLATTLATQPEGG